MENHRWIVYLHEPRGEFEVRRAMSLSGVFADSVEWFFRNYAAVYGSEATATVYAYTPEDWDIAREFSAIGCPFDYPRYCVSMGPKGGVHLEHA